MISIDDAYVDAAAPNAAAIKNGRGLVHKGKFLRLHQSADQTLLFGECQGSGKSNYHCSCDFIRPGQPTHRCSCPSRQFPCKHCLGLMYAFAQGKTFTEAEVPADLAEKREKLQQRSEQKQVAATKPRKVNKSALAKKIKAQLDGLDLLETLTSDLLQMGMGNTNAKTAREIEKQAKQLGNAYLPGAQAALHQYTGLFAGTRADVPVDEVSSTQREAVYSLALDQLTRLHALVKRGRNDLQARLADSELQPETDTGIAAWLGHAWQLRELRDAGLVEQNAELVQLAFNSYDNHARREYIDSGIWINLTSGQIQLTQTFRPYKAVKYIKGEDSFFQLAEVAELCVYPGDLNQRIRWEEMTARPLQSNDFSRIRKQGQPDFKALIKQVKGHLKSPLAEKNPLFLINFTRLGRVGDQYVIEDADRQRIVLTDRGIAEEPASCQLLEMLPRDLLTNQTLLGRFDHNLDTQQLCLKPLSLVTSTAIVRLTF